MVTTQLDNDASRKQSRGTANPTDAETNGFRDSNNLSNNSNINNNSKDHNETFGQPTADLTEFSDVTLTRQNSLEQHDQTDPFSVAYSSGTDQVSWWLTVSASWIDCND